MRSKLRNRVIMLSLLGFVGSQVAFGQEYVVTRLDMGPDVFSFGASHINNYGQIVGTWTHADTFEIHGFVHDGEMRDLGLGMYPRAISDDGFITGNNAGGEAFLYDPNTDSFSPLGTLGGVTSVGNGVNDLGEAAGESDMAGTTPNRAFLYTGGAMIDLGTPTNIGTLVTDYTKANGLNDAGLVVGEALVGFGGERWAIPFVYDSSDPGATMLKISGSFVSGSAWALNELGHVAGWKSDNEDFWGHAFLHDGITMTDLGTIPGKAHTIATAVNNLDVVVGQAFGEWVWADWCQCNVWTNNIKRAFIYSNSQILDLNTMIPDDETGELTIPLGINDSGKILTPLGGEIVVLSPIVTADPNDDGHVDLADFASFVDCLAGADADPAPASSMHPAECIRLVDFDRDYDVDTADFARLQVWMTDPGRVLGSVAYTGTATGDIHVTATGTETGFQYHAIIAGPGPFTIDLWRTDDYEVSAFLDSNGNGVREAGEPWAPAMTNPIHVQGKGGLVENILVDLGPYALEGLVAYEDATPAPGVTISVQGPTVASTSTGADGTYFLADLLGGDYIVSPSDPIRYFYPFDAAVQLVGQDVAGVDFETHDLPTGEVDGETMGLVAAVDLQNYSISIDVAGNMIVVYVYADTTYSGFATMLEEVTLGHVIEAQFYTPSNLAVHIDTDPAG